MARTLNCGIGYVVICSPDSAEEISAVLKKEKETVYQIGEIKNRNASDEKLVFHNMDDSWK